MTFTRRNLPHLYFELGIYFVTFRLAGSLPPGFNSQPDRQCYDGNKINSQPDRLCYDSNNRESKNLFINYDRILDSGAFGGNYLINDEIAGRVKYCLHYPDGIEYKLICYTVMSNHVHTVFSLLEGNKGLSKIMQSIKGISARESNKILNRTGKFWQVESFDRLIRNENEFWNIVRYVLNNPVKTKLVKHWKDWKHSYCHPDYSEIIGL